MSERNLGRQFSNVFSLQASRMAGRSVRAESPQFKADADQAMSIGNSHTKPRKPTMFDKAMKMIGLGDPE